MNFYISDCHFGHKNIVAYDHRPFFSVDEMDAEMIRNWQSVVSDNDTVYILGDFCWNNATRWNEILDQLPGYKVAILGNHDQVTVDYEMTKKFLAEVSAKYEVPIRAYNVCATLLGYTPRTFDEITSKTGS